MENSNESQVNKQSTIKSLITDSPATFNGMVDALEGLADITDSGIDRVINAVNGLSNAVTTSNQSDAVKQATSKAIARAIESSERIESIDIEEKNEGENSPVKIEKKPVSLDIAKALASLTPNGSGLYQDNSSSQNTGDINYYDQVSNSNRATNTLQQENTGATVNNAGSNKTVFNQLNDVQSTQLSTYEKISNIEETLDKSVNSQEEVRAANKPSKAATVGAPKFERPQHSKGSDKGAESHTGVDSLTTNNNQATNTDSKLITAREVDRVEKATKEHTLAANKLSSQNSSQSTATAKEISKSHSAINELTDAVKIEVASTANNTKAINTNSHQTSATTKATKESAKASTAKTNSSNISSTTSTAASNSNSANRARLESVKQSSKSAYYRDTNNRLRTSTGRYASKEETATYEKSNKANGSRSIISSVSNHLKDNRKRQTLGYAFNGSAYGAIEEAMQAAQAIKFGAESRGLTSVDGVKKYVENKKQKGIGHAKNAVDTAKGTAIGIKSATTASTSATSNAFSKIKSKLFAGGNSQMVNENTSINGGDSADKTSHVNSAVSEANSITSASDSIASIDTDTANQQATSSNSNNESAISNSNKSASANKALSTAVSSDKATTSTSNAVSNKQVLNPVNNVVSKIENAVESSQTDKRKVAGDKITSSSRETPNNKGVNSVSRASKAKAKAVKKSKPSTVDGQKGTAANLVTNRASDSVTHSLEKYIAKHSANKATSSVKTAGKSQPLTNSVFIGAQKSTNGLSKKLSKEYHDAHMLKLDKLIKEVSNVSVGGAGGGGGSVIDDLLDLDRKRKRRKGRKGRGSNRGSSRRASVGESHSSRKSNSVDTDTSKSRQPAKPQSRFGRAKEYAKGGRFFGGGAKVAGALGAGAVGAGAAVNTVAATSNAAQAPALSAAGKAGGASKLGAGALAGAGKLVSKAIPILAIASTAYDAYDGFTNKEKQQEAFNLKSTEEANLGQKTSMALGSVLDLGGLTSGAAGLLGDGLGALGFEGAKEALTFDSGDIAKAIYDTSETLVNSGTGTVTSLAEGDFSGAASNAMTFLKTALPTFSLFSKDSSEKISEKSSEKSEGKTEEKSQSTETKNSANNASSEVEQSSNTTSPISTDNTGKPNSSVSDVTNVAGKNATSINENTTNQDLKEKRENSRFTQRIKKRVAAARKRHAERKASINGETSSDKNTTSINASAEVLNIENHALEEVKPEKEQAKPVKHISQRGQKRLEEQKAKMIAFRNKTQSKQVNNNSQSINGVSNINGSSLPALNPIQSMDVSKKESVTDISTLNTTTADNSKTLNAGQGNQQPKGETIVVSDNAKTIAALKEISKKLDLNRKTDKPNNGASSVGVNSMPKNIPTQFSDPLMERLANE